jgi:dTDP-glucose 4,6-dehydratase
MKSVLVTGSCGFIFSNYMRKVMREGGPYKFISIDKVIAPYNQYNVTLNRDHTFYMGDIADETFLNNVFAIEKPDIVIHGAAESFVDDSIGSAGPFIHSNVVGTQMMVDMALKYGVEKFIYVSTDEIYGQLGPNDQSWKENAPISPRNPYSASKAAGELIIRAAGETHGLPYIITRCCNNYGPSQPPRNLVPMIISRILQGKEVTLHDKGIPIREWIYVDDHCTAIQTLLEKGTLRETYNIGSGFGLSNLSMVKHIEQVMGKQAKISFIKDRPGQDFRYSVDFSKLSALGWRPEYSFDEGLEKCVKWYTDNDWYLECYGV